MGLPCTQQNKLQSSSHVPLDSVTFLLWHNQAADYIKDRRLQYRCDYQLCKL
jgi:hypothetical protein